MNDKEKIGIVVMAVLMILILITIGFAILSLWIRDLKAEIASMQLDYLAGDEALHARMDTADEDLRVVHTEIDETRSIIKNTNGALARTAAQIRKEKSETTETTEAATEENDMTYMGTWCISAYEWSDEACANGNDPTVWYTCAFNEAPLGATIYIPDLGYFVNEDRCGTPGRLDIFLGDVSACEQFGIQYHDVYIVN